MRDRAATADAEGALPVAYTRGHGQSIGWWKEARCRSGRPWATSLRKGGSPGLWCVEAYETYRFGDEVVSGSKLQEMALGICSMCPAQWDCTTFAVNVREPQGIWGLPHDDLEWLWERRNTMTIINNARRRRIPIQFHVARARERVEKAATVAVI